jgi:Resolvase, N terminal domain
MPGLAVARRHPGRASLDRLFRSLADLIQIVGTLCRQGVGFKRLHGALDTTTSAGGWSFTSSPGWPSSSAS